MEVAMFDELSSEDEKKKWLFKENVRLQELSRNLEDEIGRASCRERV